MPQWEADSLNSILLDSGADRPGLEYDRVEDQSGWQDKRADFRRGRSGRAGLWHDCIDLGRSCYYRLVTSWEQFGNIF